METIDRLTPTANGTDAGAQLSAQTSRTQLAAVSSSRSIDLDLVTQEGDTVTLSIDAKASALYVAAAEVQMADDGLMAQWSELSYGQLERDISLTVDGDLNRQERREIRKVIKAVNRMMHQFVKGNLDPMAAAAKKIGGLDTIDSLDVSMAYQRQVLVARQSQTRVSYDQFGQAAAVPTAEVPAEPMQVAEESQSLARHVADVVASAAVSRTRLMEAMDHLFKAHRRRARHMHPMGARIIDQIRDLFEAALGKNDTDDPAMAVRSVETVD